MEQVVVCSPCCKRNRRVAVCDRLDPDMVMPLNLEPPVIFAKTVQVTSDLKRSAPLTTTVFPHVPVCKNAYGLSTPIGHNLDQTPDIATSPRRITEKTES